MGPRLVEFTGLPVQGTILDFGSGTGSLAFAIAEHGGARVLGIDPSKGYVAYARSRNPFPDRVTFEAGDAQQLHFPDASFDAALSLLALNFIPDPKRALSELHRVVKPGGKIAAAVWDYGAGMQMLRVFWDAATSIDPDAEKFDEKHMPLCRACELAVLWREAGLESVDEQSIETPMKFESLADYWDPFLLGQGPAGSYVRRLDRAKLQALREEVKRRLSLLSTLRSGALRSGEQSDNSSGEDRPFVLPARVWSVRGTIPNRR